MGHEAWFFEVERSLFYYWTWSGPFYPLSFLFSLSFFCLNRVLVLVLFIDELDDELLHFSGGMMLSYHILYMNVFISRFYVL